MTTSSKACWHYLIPVLSLASLVGCSSSALVEAEFPRPLIEPLPIRVGIILSDALRTFEYYEEIPQHSKWTIQLGSANVAMFEPLFESMFREARSVTTLPLSEAERHELDAVLQPEVEKFEFDVPRNSDAKFVEVWLQYRLKLLTTDGTQIADWAIVGYGKAQKGMLGNEGSLRKAAVRAMREAGATLATGFAKQPAVGQWLEEAHDEITLSVDTSPSG